MRVAIISKNGEAGGGVETVVSWQNHVLRSVGVEVRIFKCPAWLNTKRLTLLYVFGTLTFPLTVCILARWWAGRRGKVFSHGFSSTGFLCDIVFAHGCWAEYTKRTKARTTVYYYVMWLFECLAAHLSKGVVAVSEEVKSAWIGHYRMPPWKCEVIHNTSDINVFSPSNLRISSQQCSVFRVLFAGRLEYAKGSEFLRELLSELQIEKRRDIKVKLCIPNDSCLKLPRWANGVQAVSVNSQSAMACEYNQSDALLLPSKYEAFEMVTIESLLCGTPVILNDTGTRPFLERLECPGLYTLRATASPLKQIDEARVAFKSISRDALAAWARRAFNPERYRNRLLELAGYQ